MEPNHFSSEYNILMQQYPKQFIPPKPPRAPPDEYIIPLPEKAKVVKRKRRILLVDSKDRNLTLYPNANKFDYPLVNPYIDIIQAQLISACLPKSDYIIHENNNTLYVREHNGPVDNNFIAQIPIGDYTKCNLPKAIEKELNQHSEYYLVSYDDLTDTISIANTKYQFTLIFKGGETTYGPQTTTSYEYIKGAGKIGRNTKTIAEYPNQPFYIKNSMGPVLGFGIKDVSTPNYKVDFLIDAEFDTIVIDGEDGEGDNFVDEDKKKAYVIRGQDRVNLCNCDYVLIHIPRFRRYDSFNPIVKGAFTRIPLTNEPIEFTDVDFGAIKYFNPPLPKLDKLRFTIYRPDGTLYNFRGKNFVLVFGIVCLNQPGRYSLMFDK